MKIILASSSPRRAQILRGMNLPFTVLHPNIDETVHPDEPAIVYTRRMAREKARAINFELQNMLPEASLIVASDTSVVHQKEVLGKAGTRQEARSMLTRLSGRRHYVVTAICLLHNTDHVRRLGLAHSITVVRFQDLSKQDIETYLDSDEWQGKAGAYAIQGQGSFLLDYFQGSLTGVVGFPVRTFFRMLVGMDIPLLSMYSETYGDSKT